MEGLLIGLASLAFAVCIQRVFLGNLNAKLRAKEQAFKFHALRDEVQRAVAEGRLDRSSLTYNFLIRMLNFAIRNAGVMKLREILEISEKVKSSVETSQFSRIAADVQKHDAEVQQITQKFFFAFAHMLIANDWIVQGGVKAATVVSTSLMVIKPLAQAFNKGMSALCGVITPTKAKAVREAQWYYDRGNRLNPCS